MDLNETITVDLTIENRYEFYATVVTYRKDLVIPAPPPEDGEGRQDWEYDYIYEETGVGHEDGDSWYDVEVTASSDPAMLPVGTKFEFGY